MFPAGSLLTHNCKVDLCPVCLFHQFPVELQLRGVCLDSPVDKFYVLHSSAELHGQGGSRLSWEEEKLSLMICTSCYRPFSLLHRRRLVCSSCLLGVCRLCASFSPDSCLWTCRRCVQTRR